MSKLLKLAVVGSRSLVSKENEEIIFSHLNNVRIIHKSLKIHVVSGGAKGVDTIAKRWADVNELGSTIFIPDWGKFGKAAGFIRNESIVKECDRLICFWDGKSKGGKHSFDLANKKGKKPILFQLIP